MTWGTLVNCVFPNISSWTKPWPVHLC